MAPTEDGTSEKNKAEIKKLTEEIRSLKLQRSIAILTAIGGIVSFAITNGSQLSTLLTRKPQVLFAAADEFVRRNGHVEVSTRSEKGPNIVVSGSFPASEKSYKIDPGAYRFTLRIQSDPVYQQDFTLQNGDRLTLAVRPLNQGNIKVAVENQTLRIGPGSQLTFKVDVSGNGYLWVFEKRPGGYALLYPGSCSKDCGNEVNVSSSYFIPDSKHPRQALYAGNRLGRETLLFLVTSAAESDAAQKIADRFNKGTVVKAYLGAREANWGYQDVSYMVGKSDSK